jgi:hypothetical protein
MPFPRTAPRTPCIDAGSPLPRVGRHRLAASVPGAGSPGTHPQDGCGAASRIGPGGPELMRPIRGTGPYGRTRYRICARGHLGSPHRPARKGIVSGCGARMVPQSAPPTHVLRAMVKRQGNGRGRISTRCVGLLYGPVEFGWPWSHQSLHLFELRPLPGRRQSLQFHFGNRIGSPRSLRPSLPALPLVASA